MRWGWLARCWRTRSVEARARHIESVATRLVASRIERGDYGPGHCPPEAAQALFAEAAGLARQPADGITR